tara:strand:+ start:279 stop:539 length:261 start_codon:yes stop_codon:yes gene_type:complete
MKSVPELRDALKSIQLRLSVQAGRELRHSDLAELACVSPRSIGEWMRGTSSPGGMIAILRLLAMLPPDQVSVILDEWKQNESIVNR